MISINANLSSLIVQSNLKTSSSGLSKAIQRMTTGYKINGAKDNAAGFSISTGLTTKLSAYQTAQDNVSMGLDMVQTASSSLSSMADLGSRLRALATQASNGTYGSNSIGAINSEAGAIILELNRIKNNTEYNGMNLFDSKKANSTTSTNQITTYAMDEEVAVQTSSVTPPKAAYSGFIEKVDRRDTSAMTSVASLDENAEITSGTYSISSKEELQKLATMGANKKLKGGEFILADDIDLSGVNWTPIGRNGSVVCDFDGNGYKITNLKSTTGGLFYGVEGNIKNLGLTDVDVKGCPLLYSLVSGSISNCYSTGSVTTDGSTSLASGLAGALSSGVSVDSCYSTVDITDKSHNNIIGGLVSIMQGGTLSNSFATGNILGGQCSGGLAGAVYGSVTNCYATGNVTNDNTAAGLIAQSYADISDCYATGDVSGNVTRAGGLVANNFGGSSKYLRNCYATGNITTLYGGSYCFGGLVGNNYVNVENCYAKGNVTGAYEVGGLIGNQQGSNTTISNCYAIGDVTGAYEVGGLIGMNSNASLENCYAKGKVTGTGGVIGGLVGRNGSSSCSTKNCYATGDVTGNGQSVGGLIGWGTGTIDSCYATGNVTGKKSVAGLIGDNYGGGSILNSYATGNVQGEDQVGGLAGWSVSQIDSCYATGSISGTSTVGGLVGKLQSGGISNSYTTSTITADDKVGGLTGECYANISTSYANGKVNGKTTTAGVVGKWYSGTLSDTYYNIDKTGMTIGVADGADTAIGITSKQLKQMIADGLLPYFQPTGKDVTLQVGINSDASSQIDFTILDIDLSDLDGLSMDDANALETIDDLLKTINEQQVNLGSIENRLDSALESITLNIDNLTSTRSTIRDADIAEESSAYIRNQILQQASATLLATANQTPAIALQLL